MNKTAIIFLHHTVNDVVVHNFAKIKQFNPTSQVFSVGFAWHQLLPDSHVVRRTSELPNNETLNESLGMGTSSESDLCIYDFYMHHQEFDSYFIVEWDTYCNSSIEEVYGTAMKNLHSFSAFKFTNKIDAPEVEKSQRRYVKEWSWYHYFESFKSPEHKEKLLPHLGGMYPTSILYFKNEVLYKMMEILLANPRLYDNIQNEMRLGTLVQHAGFEINEHGGHTNQFFEQAHYREEIKQGIPGYYHPIKEIL